MIPAYLYRVAGAAGCVALVLNVHKHGWHPVSIAIGSILSAIMLSLGVAPERRTLAWEIRYVIAAVSAVALAAFRFLR
jgi:hypothetical protein